MSIYVNEISILGNDILEENFLPKFRKGESGILPYLLQDRYSRKKIKITKKAIVMENRHMKAVFLPQYGMRLISLYSYDEKRELLFHNPVLQFANLAIRNAWFSGGIEWNIGKLGHAFTTCDHVFAGIVHGKDGEEILRCYEYERALGIYWSVDFSMREEDSMLFAYVRIVNPKKEFVPIYWWTNIAVPEIEGCRVFSATDEVLYIEPPTEEMLSAKKMRRGKLPALGSLPGQDATYPRNFDFASEYFFQNSKKLKKVWEGIAYSDGSLFFECSTEKLRYRKMFCWGTHQGGQNWKDYLSLPGKGDYVELQAGLAPTQLDTMMMPENCTWDFLQGFGGAHTDYSFLSKDWKEGQEEFRKIVDRKIDDGALEEKFNAFRTAHNDEIDKLLFMGSGYGALEEIRNPGCSPKWLFFPEASIGDRELVWKDVLSGKPISDIPVQELPMSYMVDRRYEEYLQKAAGNGYLASALLGILYQEQGETEKAVQCYHQSLAREMNPLALRNLFTVFRETEPEKAEKYMEEALMLLSPVRREYAEEYIEFLTRQEKYDKVWKFYQSLPAEMREMDIINLNVMHAATALKQVEFLERQYAHVFSCIREGSEEYSNGYFVFQALKKCRISGEDDIGALADQYKEKDQIPKRLDFRQNGRRSGRKIKI